MVNFKREFPELGGGASSTRKNVFFPAKTSDESGYIELETMITSVEHDIKDIYRIVARAQREVYQKIRDKCGLSEMSIKVRRGFLI